MARKKEEINKICGKRLRQVISKNNLTQALFAEKFDCAEQTVSYIVNGKRRLTSANARRIANMFPPTRFEWLLGYDDYETELEKKIREAVQEYSKELFFLDYVQKSAMILGYSILEHRFEDIEILSYKLKNGELKAGSEDFSKAVKEVAMLEDKYKDRKYDIYCKGNLSLSCGEEALNFLIQEVNSFIKFRLYELIGHEG